MKTIVTLITAVILGNSFAQDIKPFKNRNPKFEQKTNVRVEKRAVKKVSEPEDIFGNYQIIEYTVYGTKTPSKKHLNQLMGTLVKVQKTSVTGNEIDPITYEMYEIEEMTNIDFIYRVFGRNIHEAETDLPPSLFVHKTSHDDCYGIVDMGNGEIAVPYKGVLLFLKVK